MIDVLLDITVTNVVYEMDNYSNLKSKKAKYAVSVHFIATGIYSNNYHIPIPGNVIFCRKLRRYDYRKIWEMGVGMDFVSEGCC